MLRTLSKREQPSVCDAPCVEAFDDGIHEVLGDLAIPEVGADGQRPEKSHASPAGGKIRPDQFAVPFGAKGSGRIRWPPRAGIGKVRPKLLGLWCTQERAERDPYNVIGCRKILLRQRTDVEHHLSS